MWASESDPEREAREAFARLDDLYRALGRYVFVFSRLQLLMRAFISRRLARPDETAAVDIALAETTAYPLRNAYFALCGELGDLDDDEKRVGKELFAKMPDYIEQRNDFLHGDCEPVAFDNDGRPTGGLLVRTKPSCVREDIVGTKSYSATDIDRITNELRRFGNDVIEYGALSLAEDTDLRVRDVFVVKRSKVVAREGPRASEATEDRFPL